MLHQFAGFKYETNSPKNYSYIYYKNHLTYYGKEQYKEVIQKEIKKNINIKNITND